VLIKNDAVSWPGMFNHAITLIFYNHEVLTLPKNCAVKFEIALVLLGFCSLLGCVRRYLATDYIPRGNVNHLIHSWNERSRAKRRKRASSSVFLSGPVSYFMIIDRNVETVCFFRLKLTVVVLKEMIESQVPVISSRWFGRLSRIPLPLHSELKCQQKVKDPEILTLPSQCAQSKLIVCFRYNVNITKFMALCQRCNPRSRLIETGRDSTILAIFFS